MIINNIYFDDNFVSMLKKTDIRIQKLFVKKVELFRIEPFNNWLRLHKLSWKLEWLWSISINMSYRVIFKPKDWWNILFVSIWKHSIYDKWIK